LLFYSTTRYRTLHLLLLVASSAINYRERAEIVVFLSHQWFLEDANAAGQSTHWKACHPGCGCGQMSITDIAYLLPHHLNNPAHGYVIKSPVDNSRLLQKQPNSLANIAIRVVLNQLKIFLFAAYYPSSHFGDFEHA